MNKARVILTAPIALAAALVLAGCDEPAPPNYWETGLPIVYIDTEEAHPDFGQNEDAPYEEYHKTNVRIVDAITPDNNFESTGYKDNIRGRGHASWKWYSKKPYRIKFDKKQALFKKTFGEDAAKSWTLIANQRDRSLSMNDLGFTLGRIFNLEFTPHAVHVELVMNGEYLGSYSLCEHIGVGKGRVDIDEDDGFLVEIDAYYDEETGPKFRTTAYNLPVIIKSPEPDEDADNPDNPAYEHLKTALDNLTAAMYNSDAAAPNDSYNDLIDIDSVVNYLLVQEIMGNNGEMEGPKSAFMYQDKGGKIKMGPLWDFDAGFSYGGGDLDYFEFTDDRSLHPFFKRFFDDPAFRTAYKNRWNEMKDIVSIMPPALIDDFNERLWASKEANFDRWPAKDWTSFPNKMKIWWKARVTFLDSDLNKPETP